MVARTLIQRMVQETREEIRKLQEVDHALSALLTDPDGLAKVVSINSVVDAARRVPRKAS